jgi:hypothetical protein
MEGQPATPRLADTHITDGNHTEKHLVTDSNFRPAEVEEDGDKWRNEASGLLEEWYKLCKSMTRGICG